MVVPSPARLRDFLHFQESIRASGYIQSLVLIGTGKFLFCIKCPERQADYSVLSTADIKNGWNYKFTPQMFG